MSDSGVAVILLNWNGLNDTIACVESLQASDESVRIYIVDNGSDNKEAEILQSRFPQFRVLRQQTNLGFCGGNNIGIRQAIQEGAFYILILNNDTLVPPDAVRVLRNEFIRLGDAGALSPIILERHATTKVWFARAKWDTARAQFSLNPDALEVEQIKAGIPWETEFACGCCLFTSVEVLEKVGLLDERYFAFYDEAEWCLRLQDIRLRSYTTPNTMIYHKVSSSTPGLVATYLMARNRLLWMRENLSFFKGLKSLRYLIRELIWHVLNRLRLVKGNYSRNHSRAFLQGVVDFCFNRYGKWGAVVQRMLVRNKN